MNFALKKQIVNLVYDFFSFICLFIAILCLIFKLKSLENFKLDNLEFLAVKSVWPRGNFSFDFKDIFNNNLYANDFSDFENQNENSIFKYKNLNKQSDVKIPDFKTDSETQEYHSPDEIKHKIIENHFSAGGIKFENIYVKNRTGLEIDISKELEKSPEINIKNTKEPQVLIVHTHTSESYMKDDSGFYYDSFYPRTADNTQNITRVGQAITDKLIENGINTVHDITCHDNPTYNGSYSRAARTIEENLKKYPSIQVVIDIHRDSLGSNETGKIKPVFKYNDKKSAQLMIISGCDPDQSLGHPNWEKNLRLALRLQKYCETLFPGITRPLNFAKVRYNQHLTPGSMLIEVGSDANTLEEAVNTGYMLGQALSNLLNDLKKQ